jgi:primosomal replication protein N
MNRLVLSGSLVRRGALRYTPAGLPAVDFELQHESSVVQDGQERKVSMSLKALAIGSIVPSVAGLALGAPAVFDGFLAASRNGRGLLYHVTEVRA